MAGSLALVGMILIGAARHAIQGGGFFDGLLGGVIGLLWGGLLSGPLGVLWVVVFVVVIRLLGQRCRRVEALAGLGAGVAVGSVMFVVVGSFSSTSSGALEEQLNFVNGERLALVLPVLWSGAAGAMTPSLAALPSRLAQRPKRPRGE